MIETSTYQANYDFEGQENIALSGLWQLHIYFMVSDIKLEAMWKDKSKWIYSMTFFCHSDPSQICKKANDVNSL